MPSNASEAAALCDCGVLRSHSPSPQVPTQSVTNFDAEATSHERSTFSSSARRPYFVGSAQASSLPLQHSAQVQSGTLSLSPASPFDSHRLFHVLIPSQRGGGGPSTLTIRVFPMLRSCCRKKLVQILSPAFADSPRAGSSKLVLDSVRCNTQCRLAETGITLPQMQSESPPRLTQQKALCIVHCFSFAAPNSYPARFCLLQPRHHFFAEETKPRSHHATVPFNFSVAPLPPVKSPARQKCAEARRHPGADPRLHSSPARCRPSPAINTAFDCSTPCACPRTVPPRPLARCFLRIVDHWLVYIWFSAFFNQPPLFPLAGLDLSQIRPISLAHRPSRQSPDPDPSQWKADRAKPCEYQ